MARIAGKDGAVAIASTGTLHLRQWSLNYAQAAIDTTAFGDAARAKVPGIKEFRGTARGALDSATAPALPTTTVAATFTAASGRTWIGNVVVTEITPDVSIDGEAQVSFTFEGDGDLTLA